MMEYIDVARQIASGMRIFKFPENVRGFPLTSGRKLSEVDIAFETYGKPNEDASNCVLVCHALSGDYHASSLGKDNEKGWWEGIIGWGKGIDTSKYFVVCSNVLGSCRGSTGPSSNIPETGRRYGLDFPQVSIEGMVNAQARLLDYLGIEKVLSVIGGSMGGMQVVQWMKSYPHRIRSAIPIATALRHTPMQIAFNKVGRRAIMSDPDWNGGNYYDSTTPIRGLAVARMLGHITYLSDTSLRKKFGRMIACESGRGFSTNVQGGEIPEVQGG
ncbi:MAG: homoserine O-acetyltransferase MetX [Thermoplasmata archaeon]